MTEDRTIQAFNQRVRTYDADMAVLQPNRSKMCSVIVDWIPFPEDQEFSVIDLGIGTGFLSHRILQSYPNARIIGIDGSEKMMEVAKARLRDFLHRVSFRKANFMETAETFSDLPPIDLVVSSFALHHLNKEQKAKVFERCHDVLVPGGWFLNADLLLGENDISEHRFQELRVDGIIVRAGGRIADFKNRESTRSYLKALEEKEGDQPVRLTEDLEILTNSGFFGVDIFWKEYREAVYGGMKPKL